MAWCHSISREIVWFIHLSVVLRSGQGPRGWLGIALADRSVKKEIVREESDWLNGFGLGSSVSSEGERREIDFEDRHRAVYYDSVYMHLNRRLVLIMGIDIDTLSLRQLPEQNIAAYSHTYPCTNKSTTQI